MDLPQLSEYKYQHSGRVALSGKRKPAFFVSLLLAVLASILLFPFGFVALIVPVLVYSTRPRTLSIGPRYLICGNDIVYFANVTQMELVESSGHLRLQTASGKTLLIERERFPTNARKTNKIAANKAAKFNKVSAKIMEKVRRATPAQLGVGPA